jgi:nucleotide-binding universal stress UspA family protein
MPTRERLCETHREAGKKILIAYDGSECSDSAIVDLRRAGLPAAADVVVLSIADICRQFAEASYGAPGRGAGIYIPESVPNRESSGYALAEAQAFAAQAADRLREDFPNWNISTEAWVDTPRAAIARKAHAWEPDLIVVGSHGYSGISRLMLGSVSQHVLNHVTFSVRISRHRLHSQERAIRLLIGVDGSAGSEAAVKAVAARNWPRGTEARVVGVVDSGSMLANPFTATPEAVGRAMEEEWESRLSATVEAAARELRESGVRATGRVLSGKACSVLLDEAEKWAVDCVFVGARGLNGLQRILLGSVSTAVASKAHCSVEVVKLHTA